MDGLERNNGLRDLNLKHNFIEGAGAIRISKLFEQFPVFLKVLNLSENRLGDEGGKMIAKALAKNTACSTKLILFDTEIKDECAKELTQTLRINKSLKEISIGWNSLSPKYINQIKRL